MKILQSIPYPTYTTAQRDALVDVLNNFKINNVDTGKVEEWDGSAWTEQGSGGTVASANVTLSTVPIGSTATNVDEAIIELYSTGRNQITTATAWNGTSYTVTLDTSQILKRTVNTGTTTLTFALSYPADAVTVSRLTTVEIDNSANTSAISTITFTGTWTWGLGVQPTGLAAGAKAVLYIYNNSATSVRASWEVTA